MSKREKILRDAVVRLRDHFAQSDNPGEHVLGEALGAVLAESAPSTRASRIRRRKRAITPGPVASRILRPSGHRRAR